MFLIKYIFTVALNLGYQNVVNRKRATSDLLVNGVPERVEEVGYLYWDKPNSVILFI